MSHHTRHRYGLVYSEDVRQPRRRKRSKSYRQPARHGHHALHSRTKGHYHTEPSSTWKHDDALWVELRHLRRLRQPNQLAYAPVQHCGRRMHHRHKLSCNSHTHGQFFSSHPRHLHYNFDRWHSSGINYPHTAKHDSRTINRASCDELQIGRN